MFNFQISWKPFAQTWQLWFQDSNPSNGSWLAGNMPDSWQFFILNTLRPSQNGHHFADDTFNRIFVNENVRISIKFSLKFLSKVPIDNIPALVQIMAWCRSGDKPLSEPMMDSLMTHICVTRPQWVNRLPQLIRWQNTLHINVIDEYPMRNNVM